MNRNFLRTELGSSQTHSVRRAAAGETSSKQLQFTEETTACI